LGIPTPPPRPIWTEYSASLPPRRPVADAKPDDFQGPIRAVGNYPGAATGHHQDNESSDDTLLVPLNQQGAQFSVSSRRADHATF
jgi:hypothetical protein